MCVETGRTELQLHAKNCRRTDTGTYRPLVFARGLRHAVALHTRAQKEKKEKRRRSESWSLRQVEAALILAVPQLAQPPVHFPTGAEVDAPESGVRLRRLRMEPREVEAAPHAANDERARGDGAIPRDTHRTSPRLRVRAHCCPQLQVLPSSRGYSLQCAGR